jgi:hypothetical protein
MMNFNTKKFLVVLFLWIFAPISWLIMWKDERFHSWFPPLLFANGIIFAFMFITQAYTTFPKLEYLYQKYSIHELPFATGVTASFLIFFAVAQIVVGQLLKDKLKRDQHIADPYISFIILIFSLDFLFGFLTGLLGIVLPIDRLKMLL